MPRTYDRRIIGAPSFGHWWQCCFLHTQTHNCRPNQHYRPRGLPIFLRFFFLLTPFCRDKVSKSCFYWSASRQWNCLCEVQGPSPNTKSTDESGLMGGEGRLGSAGGAAGVCGVWWEFCLPIIVHQGCPSNNST